MAKKSSIQSNNKRIELAKKYSHRRMTLKQQKKSCMCLADKNKLSEFLQLLPRNSSPTRIYRRCIITGRTRSVYRSFGLSRQVLREMFNEGLLPGILKASW